jgi:amino acid permease
MAFGNYRGETQNVPDKRAEQTSVLSSDSSPEPLIENAREEHDHEGDFVTANERKDLARGLHQRHIGLIALAGAIVCFHFLSLVILNSQQ